LADENPAANREEWHRFLQEMATRDIPVYFFASIRTTDIVRDVEILHLYRKAGILYILLGIESAAPEVLEQIKKGSTRSHDIQAIRLLKQNGIFSIVAHVIGLKNETWKTFRTAIQQLIHYDGDFVNVTHLTPHRWTDLGRQVKDHSIVQHDLSKWDYRHQVIDQPNFSSWKIFFAVKLLELSFHARPGRLWAILRTRDRFRRRQLLWSTIHIGMVWLGEILLLKTTRPVKRIEAPCSKLQSASGGFEM
jgi:anaerobic magnesium-protoporphyrin IX monomethyl ester cyclase